MNKKVLTLCFSALLMGGMLSPVNASLWENDYDAVLNTDKYYTLGVTAVHNSGWGASQKEAEYVLSVTEDGKFILTKDKDSKAAYWKITTDSKTGVTKYVLQNANGETLKYTHAEGTTDEVVIEQFGILGENGQPGVPQFNALYYTVGKSTTRYYLQKGKKIDNNSMEVTFATDQNDGKVVGFNNFDIDEESISVKDLNAELQGGFQIQIGKSGKNAYEEFENWAETKKGFGNVFAGKLTAVDVNGKTNTDAEEFYLKSGDKYIVLTDALWGGTNSDLNGKDAYKGYQFELVSAHTFETTYKDKKNNAIFKIEKTYDFDQAYGDSLIVSMPKVKVGDMESATDVRLFVAEVNNKSYLTIIESAVADDRLTEDDAKELPYVRFGASNIVNFKDFAGKVWNITNGNKSLSPDAISNGELDNFLSEFDPEGEVMLNAPEGEWLPYYETEYNYGFVNRESGVKWNLAGDYNGYAWVIRQVGTNAYRVWSSKYDTDVNDDNQLKYVINITEATSKVGKQADGSYKSFTEAGYARYEDAVKELEGKYITLKNGVTGATMYVGKNADDEVILTEDQTEAIEFRVKELKHDYIAHDGYAAVDTLHHYTTYYGYDADGNLSTNVQDTVQFQHFRLFDHFSEKALVYTAGKSSEHKFILSEIASPENAHEDFNAVIKGDNNNANNIFSTFVLKKKADGNYNLVSCYDIQYPSCTGNHNYVNGDFTDNFIETNLYDIYREYGWSGYSMKMEGNVGKATVDNTANIYTHKNEDRFALVDIETPEYLTLEGFQDTIKVSPVGAENYFLYEQGKNGTNFLGINHIADVKDMAAAILAEASNGSIENNFKPQYLLGVDAEYIPEVRDSKNHLIEPDSTVGRFLVNMVDSAFAYGIDKKSNPYIFDSKVKFRLGFVDGIRTDNKLFLTKDGKKTGRVFDLNNNDDKVCTFAFRYVDNAREAVKIETRYNTTAENTITRGWIEICNGVPVVVNNYDLADDFIVNADVTGENPTANENITAGNVVVAGVDGAVVVKGAEGKNVIVSTILGKVVANEVVSSDNATIAAPAGIVVVSVDGESFKVVVK